MSLCEVAKCVRLSIKSQFIFLLFQLLLQEMDINLAEVHKNLPKGTLFVVILGGANTSWLKRLVVHEIWECSSHTNHATFLFCRLRENGEQSKVVKKAVKEIQRGLCFIKLV